MIEPTAESHAADQPRRRELGAAGRSAVGRRGRRRQGRRRHRQARVRPAPGVRPAVAEVVHGPPRWRGHDAGGRHRDLEGALPRRSGRRASASTRRCPGSSPARSALLEIRRCPGAPVKLSTGVLVLYADDESFTFMTPEGHTLSAWITFSARRDGDVDGRPGAGARATVRPVRRARLHARRQPPEQQVLAGDAAATSRSWSASRRRSSRSQSSCIDRNRQWRYWRQRPQQRDDPIGAADARPHRSAS